MRVESYPLYTFQLHRCENCLSKLYLTIRKSETVHANINFTSHVVLINSSTQALSQSKAFGG